MDRSGEALDPRDGELLRTLPVGGETRDPEQLALPETGLEALFRTEVGRQYQAWPRGSTTDGTSIRFCARRDADSVEVAGVTWLDFNGSVFPSRALLSKRDGSATVVVFVGQVDPQSGAPPAMPAGTLVLPTTDEDGLPHPELLLGHRQVGIEWTKVLEFP